jgi:hypothetical protein
MTKQSSGQPDMMNRHQYDERAAWSIHGYVFYRDKQWWRTDIHGRPQLVTDETLDYSVKET